MSTNAYGGEARYRRDCFRALNSVHDMSQLSSGICRRLNEAPEEEIEHLASGHTVQLLSVKKVSPTQNASTPTDRYRIIISDGIHFVQAMLATQLNDLVTTGQISKYTVIVIDRLACNFVQDKR